MDTEDLVEVYKSLFETWRFEVNSHWQRSSYFAAFETVAIAACWKLLHNSSDSTWAGIVLSLLGILLTAVWYLNNSKTHFYAVYWLEKVAVIENKLLVRGEEGIDFASQILSRKRDRIRHRHLVQAVPVIFFVAWVILLFFGIHKCVAEFVGPPGGVRIRGHARGDDLSIHLAHHRRNLVIGSSRRCLDCEEFTIASQSGCPTGPERLETTEVV